MNFRQRYERHPVKSSPEMAQYHRLKAQAYYLRGANDFGLFLAKMLIKLPPGFHGHVTNFLRENLGNFIAENRPQTSQKLQHPEFF